LRAKTTLGAFGYERQQTIHLPAPLREAMDTFQAGWQFPL
jgi:hypothetical protein